METGDEHWQQVWIKADPLAWSVPGEAERSLQDPLQQSEDSLQGLAVSLPGMLYQLAHRLDGSYCFYRASYKCMALLGLPPARLQEDAELLFQMLLEGDRARFEESLRVSAHRLTPWHWQGWIVLPSSQEKWIEISGCPRRLPDGSTLWDGLLMDTTRCKTAELALQTSDRTLDWQVTKRTAALEAEISDRKRVEAALRESQTTLANLLSNLPGMVYRCRNDDNWTMEFVSEGSLELTGYHPKQIKDNNEIPYRDLVHPADRDSVRRAVDLAILTQQPFQLTYRIDDAFGQQKWVWEQGRGVFTPDGTLLAIEGFITNITPQKQLEQARFESEQALRQKTADLEQALRELQQTQTQLIQSEKMSSLGQLMAGVAHEINNPVNFIYGNLTYANKYIADLLSLLQIYRNTCPLPSVTVQQTAEAIDLEFLLEDLPKLLQSMKVGADRIKSIVSSLRVFSRMDEAEVKAVDLHEGIDSTLMILQNRLKPTSTRPGIEVYKEYGTLPLVECYAGQLNQVFMNIISNAIDALEEAFDQPEAAGFCQAGDDCLPWIWIQTKVLPGDRIAIHIADNGRGIPPEVSQRMFDPFFTTKPVGKGTGLGMSISYQVVTEKHGGLLQCRSEPGNGAEFIIEIPTQQNPTRSA